MEDQTMPSYLIVFYGFFWYISQVFAEYFFQLTQLNIRNIYTNGESTTVTNPKNSRYLGISNIYSLIGYMFMRAFYWPPAHAVLFWVCLLSCASDMLICYGDSI